MTVGPLSQSFASSRNTLAQVTREELHRPTPCRSWDVAALINHMVGAPRSAVAALRASPPGQGDEDFAAGDFLAGHNETAAMTLAAFGAPGVLESTVALPFGELPADVFMTFIALDQYTHAWDLARATGQPTDLDPTLGAQLLAVAQGVVNDDMRGPDGEQAFGVQQAAPAGASTADRLAAFLGREA